MPVPAYPNYTLADVYDEFDVPSNVPFSALVRGGAYVINSPQNAAVSTTVAGLKLSQFGGTSKAPVATVAISNQSPHGVRISEPNPFPPPGTIRGSGTAGVTFNSTGTAALRESDINGNLASINLPGEWLTSGSAADVEVECVVSGLTTGSVSGPTGAGVWSVMSTTRSFLYSANTLSSGCTLTVRMRNRVTLAILDTAVYSCSVANS